MTWFERMIFGALNRRFDEQQQMLQQMRNEIMASIADIKAKVEAERTVEDSMVALLGQIAQMLRDSQASQDPAVQEVLDMLDNNTQAMADAVTANTPAANP